jgi:hypothetical protein
MAVPNITEGEMETYLRTFHEEYLRSVEEFIPDADTRGHLLRYSLLPCKITGYVSTLLGAGYEYSRPSHDETIEVVRGSRRVEELFVAAPAWLSKRGTMIGVGGTNIRIAGLTLEGGFPFRFSDDAADVAFSNARFKADGWSRDVLYAEIFSNRTAEFWSEAAAIRRAKDEVLTALLDLRLSEANSVDLGTYLRKFKERTVLVLGDFNDGRDRLRAIVDVLGDLGYQPILLDQVPEEPNYDLRQKFHAVASVSRFLVFEDSTPAGQIAEMYLADALHSIRIVLRYDDAKSTYMTQGMGLTSTVMTEREYDDENLRAVLTDAVSWAEQRIVDLAEQRDHTYPWRADTA